MGGGLTSSRGQRGLLGLAAAIVLALVFAASATALPADKVKDEIRDASLAPAPLFPTRIPESVGCCRARVYIEGGNFNVTWATKDLDILAGYGRGSAKLFGRLKDAVEEEGSKLLKVNIGGQKAIFAKSEETFFYLWRAQGRTYYAVNGVGNDGADRRDLRTLVATSAPLR